MKQQLLVILAALSSLPLAHAQTTELTLAELTAPIAAPLARDHGQTAEAAKARTARLYTRATTYSWNSTANQWSATPITAAFTYNANGLTTQEVTADSATQQPLNRSITIYNPGNQITSSTTESWVAPTGWRNSSRQLYTYTSNGLRTEHLHQNWLNGAWVNYIRLRYTYNAQGNRTSSIFEDWKNNAWVISSGTQTAFSYDAQQRVTEETISQWNASSRVFVPSMHYLNTYSGTSVYHTSYVARRWKNNAWVNESFVTGVLYDTQNRVLSYDAQQWNGLAWQAYERTTSTYSPALMVNQTQRFVNGAWENYSRINQFYDADGYGHGYTIEEWSTAGWQLTAGVRLTDAFNASNDVVRRVTQIVSSVTRTYINHSKSCYYDFQPFVLAARPALPAAQAQLYPNPAARTATVELSGLRTQGPVTVELLNSLGQTLRTLRVQPQAGAISQALDLTSLPAGIYSVRLHAAEGTVVKRLLRQ